MKRFRMLLLIVVPAFLLADGDAAEGQVSVGPQLLVFDMEEVGIGGRLDVELGEPLGIEQEPFSGLFGSAHANYVFSNSDVSWLLFDFNPAVPFEIEPAVTPYAGAGLNVTRVSIDDFSDTNAGLNLLGGLLFDLGNVPAFAEVRFSTTSVGTGLGGSNFISLSGGVHLGG